MSFSTLTLWRALHNFGNDMLLELGLYPGQELILMQLYDQDGQTQTDLQQAIRLDHSTISRSIRRMEQAGLLTRRPADHDKRAMNVYVTDKGLALRPGIIELWSTVEAAMADALTDGQLADYTDFATRLEQSLVAARNRRKQSVNDLNVEARLS
ncbi:MarR family winged helix-turn-helix transcriptional regulator [Umezawaea endophytica]|uniref:MarR family winged helix-turn-helix transcriptional regulator n=1 Tax=Umezawaea endophytica TaxID=1654476 RepID=UPI00406D3360